MGPVSIIVSIADRTGCVYRDGVEIGRRAISAVERSLGRTSMPRWLRWMRMEDATGFLLRGSAGARRISRIWPAS